MVRNLALLSVVALAGLIAVGGWVTYRIFEVGNHDGQQPADAIVVLGAAQYNGTPSPIFKARLDHAIALYRQGVAPWFVVTGGKLSGDTTTEAATARSYAIAHGIPPKVILFEDQGRNTLESLRGTAAVLREHGLTSAVFVSDRTHMLRVLRIAKDQGVVSYGSPTTTSPADASLESQMPFVRHELGGLALYFLVGQTT